MICSMKPNPVSTKKNAMMKSKCNHNIYNWRRRRNDVMHGGNPRRLGFNKGPSPVAGRLSAEGGGGGAGVDLVSRDGKMSVEEPPFQ